MRMSRNDPAKRWNVFNVQAQQFVYPTGFETETEAAIWLDHYRTLVPSDWVYEVRLMTATYDPEQKPMSNPLIDPSKLDIRNGVIYYKIRQQDGSFTPMTVADTLSMRLFVSWVQIHD